MDDQGSIPGRGNYGAFSLRHRCVQTGSGVHPASYPVDTGDSYPGGEADHSPPSSAKLKNA